MFLEGGPTLAAAFVAAGLVDEAVVYVAPMLLGAGRNAVADLGITTITDAVRWRLVEAHTIAPDIASDGAGNNPTPITAEGEVQSDVRLRLRPIEAPTSTTEEGI